MDLPAKQIALIVIALLTATVLVGYLVSDSFKETISSTFNSKLEEVSEIGD